MLYELCIVVLSAETDVVLSVALHTGMRSIDMKGGSKFSRTAGDSRATLPDVMTQLLVMRMVFVVGENEEQSGTLSHALSVPSPNFGPGSDF